MGAHVPSSDPNRPWPVSRRFDVEYRYIDVLQHLNHAAYFPFMETLRCDYYLTLLHSTRVEDLDIIIAEAACRYLVPVRYGQTMLGEVTPGLPLGRTSFSLLYRFRDPNGPTVYARGRTVVVTYDYAKNRPKEIPADRRERLTRDGIPLESEGWPGGAGSSGNRGVGEVGRGSPSPPVDP